MQLMLTFHNPGTIHLPVNYNYYVQSAIFSLLAQQDPKYAQLLHDTAYGGTARYKFFTFGGLLGTSRYHNKTLSYTGDLRLEIRSASREFLEILAQAAMQIGEMRLGKYTLTIQHIEGTNHQITQSWITIQTLTPIVAKEPNAKGQRAIYYDTGDVRFYRRVREAFERQYAVCCGAPPTSSIDLMMVTPGRRVVSQYKHVWLCGYHGKFQLCGEPAHLQFLYDIGLGMKTAQGYGMFAVLDDTAPHTEPQSNLS